MLSRNREGVERREVGRFAPRFHVEFRADAPHEFRRAAFRGEHAGQKKQIARLHRFRIGAERLRWRWEFDAEFSETALGGRGVSYKVRSLR